MHPEEISKRLKRKDSAAGERENRREAWERHPTTVVKKTTQAQTESTEAVAVRMADVKVEALGDDRDPAAKRLVSVLDAVVRDKNRERRPVSKEEMRHRKSRKTPNCGEE